MLGGKKTIKNTLRPYNSIGIEERDAAMEVIDSGNLSQFLGAWNEDFYGGPKVKEFENRWKDFFNVKHAISVNSWTSGLIAAIGAIGIEPGDEVIVSPWTMCASATAILHWNAIPVFADIEPERFCLDPKSIEDNISPYTKAIMAVDIFGHSADMNAIIKIAQKYKLKVISDCAQSIGASYHGSYAGTLADIGGFSLNYHKHIHTGEGGILVTNDDKLAEKLRLIRNHGEAVVGNKGEDNLVNMVGYNFRLGEIESAIGIEQLKKLPGLINSRQIIAKQLNDGLEGLPCLTLPGVENECTHVYYNYAMSLNSKNLGLSKDIIVQALRAEGVPISSVYENIHLLPMFQKKIAYGSKGFPWSSEICHRDIDYSKGICPTAERLKDETYIGMGLCNFEYNENEVNLIIEAFHKVWQNLDKLS